ncbi:MAG: protein kinase, partial [Actinomycetota bacterium]
MDEKREQLKNIFDAALRQKAGERERFVDEKCTGDETLGAEIKSLLSVFEEAEEFMDGTAIDEVADVILEQQKPEKGRCFGHYEIIEQIGAGGMGEVYLARDKKLDRPVAVKILTEKLSSHEINRRRFIQEAKAVSALNHPNILVIHEIGEDQEAHYIVSEFIEGRTLRELIGNSPISLTDILDISIQIAAALTAAHSINLVHRDIKPENIMVRPDGLVKVLDFGLAKLSEPHPLNGMVNDPGTIRDETAPGILLGTVKYMSPEQAKGEKIDARSDLFSLGTVIYEMIARQTPFGGESMPETWANLFHAEPQPLSNFAPGIPEKMQQIVAKMLAKNREERYQTAQILLADLQLVKRRLELNDEKVPEEISARATDGGKLNNRETFVEKSFADLLQKVPPNNLSGKLEPLIGREKEIREIKDLLRRPDGRLVTMTGIGGTGKTRLAQTIARELLSEFADGVYFVYLAAINNSELIGSTIAKSLGIKEAGSKSLLGLMEDFLGEKQILLIIDNFEQVIDAAPQLVELMAAAANLKILVTSRVRLRLSAEREFVLSPLALPIDADSAPFDELANFEAIKLFVERAHRTKPDFVLTKENIRRVAEICRQVDGLPLAIELAAARVKVLSLQTILAKLENRLQLLTGGARDLPARQQTMRGAIEWSYDLLTEDEKCLFRRLAVFVGGFTFEAAEAVGGSFRDADILGGITSLVDKSLLVSKEQADG